MAYCKAKTKLVAELSAGNFIRQHPHVYFWTFTEPARPDGVYWTKTEAETHFKPFEDWLRRNGVAHLVFWERQQRGAWHPHVLVDRRIEVDWLRPWMVARGWGPIMKCKYVVRGMSDTDDGRGPRIGPKRLVGYLVKYLTKAYTDDLVEPRKKFFGGSRDAKAGNVRFKWVPWVEPHAMLYHWGRIFFRELHKDTLPTFRDMRYILKLGVEYVDWTAQDPWYVPYG